MGKTTRAAEAGSERQTSVRPQTLAPLQAMAVRVQAVSCARSAAATVPIRLVRACLERRARAAFERHPRNTRAARTMHISNTSVEDEWPYDGICVAPDRMPKAERRRIPNNWRSPGPVWPEARTKDLSSPSAWC